MSEKVGKHKGAVETLLHEKKELSRLLQIVNSQLERHLKALKEEGIDTDQFIENLNQQRKESQAQKKQNQEAQRKTGKSPRQSSGSGNTGKESPAGEDSGDRDFSPL